MIPTEKILAIIVTYNAMKWAEKCLTSLSESNSNVDAFIVDNGSTDGTQNFIRTKFPQFQFIQSIENIGFGAANNLGLKYALDNGYDYVYLLNQDAWIYPETISQLIEISKLNPDYGIISPLQYSKDEKTLDFGFQRIYNNSANMTMGDLVEVPFIMAAHWFIPITVIKKVGGFSPTFFHYGEDNNLIDRLHYHGLKVGVHKCARSIHDRYNRPASREKQIYLKKTSNLIRMSSPIKPLWQSTLKSLLLSIAFSVKGICIKPLLDFFEILGKFSDIKTNRKISKKDQAFLSN